MTEPSAYLILHVLRIYWGHCAEMALVNMTLELAGQYAVLFKSALGVVDYELKIFIKPASISDDPCTHVCTSKHDCTYETGNSRCRHECTHTTLLSR